MKIAVVNVAVGAWHPKGQERLTQSLYDVGYMPNAGRNCAVWKDVYPEGSPNHTPYWSPQLPGDVPYAFKVHAMEQVRAEGFDIALWADASVWFVRPLEPLIEKIEKDGYWISLQGAMVGEWCTDSALEGIGMSREEAFKVPMMCATFFGLDFRHPKTCELFDWWAARARDGSFVGDWTNEHGQVSSDPRVRGHRHDQTLLSIAWHKWGFAFDQNPCMFALPGYGPDVFSWPEVIAVGQGMA